MKKSFLFIFLVNVVSAMQDRGKIVIITPVSSKILIVQDTREEARSEGKVMGIIGGATAVYGNLLLLANKEKIPNKVFYPLLLVNNLISWGAFNHNTEYQSLGSQQAYTNAKTKWGLGTAFSIIPFWWVTGK